MFWQIVFVFKPLFSNCLYQKAGRKHFSWLGTCNSDSSVFFVTGLDYPKNTDDSFSCHLLILTVDWWNTQRNFNEDMRGVSLHNSRSLTFWIIKCIPHCFNFGSRYHRTARVTAWLLIPKNYRKPLCTVRGSNKTCFCVVLGAYPHLPS